MISTITNPVRYVHPHGCSLLSWMKAASFFLINASSWSLEFSYPSPSNNLRYCFPPLSHVFLTCPFYWHFSFGIQCDKFSSLKKKKANIKPRSSSSYYLLSPSLQRCNCWKSSLWSLSIIFFFFILLILQPTQPGFCPHVLLKLFFIVPSPEDFQTILHNWSVFSLLNS